MEDDIKSSFGLIWPRHVSSLTELLIAARKAFDGDLDLFLVLAVIGDRTFSQRHVDPDMQYKQWQAEGAVKTRPEDINIRSIAAYSGIPRETVRRKLAILVEKGWIEREGGELIKATRKAREDLEPLTEASIKYLDRMFRLLEPLKQK
ncbi:helix-turn-helix domain-containing protein [Aestuariivirga sp.]|uniref:helix-turn-helix domain-containing protein n=1 Tax=Aestuariivirga sp. TaxID=2650926 RepID=UPI0039194E87